MNKKIILLFSLFITITFIIINASITSISIKKPDLDERREKIIFELNSAIEDAVEAGAYKCCIKPACTMCYLDGNKWNYGKAGTCYCDDFIAKGEEPCPQCKRGIDEGLCTSTVKEVCDVTGEENFKSMLE